MVVVEVTLRNCCAMCDTAHFIAFSSHSQQHVIYWQTKRSCEVSRAWMDPLTFTKGAL
jgi:hypothetical protein